jgi:exosome complex component RRP45
VTGELVPPSRDRPNEGRLYFSVQDVEGSNPNTFESVKGSGDLVQVCNHVERVLRGSKAIDTESLCVLGGKSVWSIRCDTFIEHDDGGLKDVCSLAALCALMSFRHEAVAYEGNRAVLFPVQSREPVPISIHHLPISTTFALFDTPANGISWFVDPSSDEEHAFQSIISVTVNQHGELCGIDKSGGLPISTDTLSEFVLAAVNRAQQISRDIRSSLGK